MAITYTAGLDTTTSTSLRGTLDPGETLFFGWADPASTRPGFVDATGQLWPPKRQPIHGASS